MGLDEIIYGPVDICVLEAEWWMKRCSSALEAADLTELGEAPHRLLRGRCMRSCGEFGVQKAGTR